MCNCFKITYVNWKRTTWIWHQHTNKKCRLFKKDNWQLHKKLIPDKEKKNIKKPPPFLRRQTLALEIPYNTRGSAELTHTRTHIASSCTRRSLSCIPGQVECARTNILTTERHNTWDQRQDKGKPASFPPCRKDCISVLREGQTRSYRWLFWKEFTEEPIPSRMHKEQ